MNIDKRKLEVIIDVFSDLEYIYESEYSAKLSEEQQTLFKELKEALTLTSVVGRSEQLKSKKCGMCDKKKEDDGHYCCEDCGGISF